MEHSRASAFSHINLTAGVFVALLVGVVVWQGVTLIVSKREASTLVASAATLNQATTTSLSGGTDDQVTAVSNNAINQIYSAYNALQQNGTYSTTTANQVGAAIGQSLQTPVTYNAFTAAAIKTDPDISYQGMVKYRTALQASLKPLLNNKTPEYTLFGMYVETHQQTYLDQLSAASNNYKTAAAASAQITVPADAVSVQLGLLNSMQAFAADLDALVAHADDPIGSTILLQNYNQGEADVLSAFQALVTYEKSK